MAVVPHYFTDRYYVLTREMASVSLDGCVVKIRLKSGHMDTLSWDSEELARKAFDCITKQGIAQLEEIGH